MVLNPDQVRRPRDRKLAGQFLIQIIAENTQHKGQVANIRRTADAPFRLPFEICAQNFGTAEIESIRGSWLGLGPPKAVSQQLVQERFSGRNAQRWLGAIPYDDVIVADGS